MKNVIKQLTKSLVFVLGLGVCGGLAAQSSENTLMLHNYETSKGEMVNVESLSKEEAMMFIPRNVSVTKLFKSYLSAGSTPGHALVSTLVDINEAKQPENKMVEMVNFSTRKREFVDIDSLSYEEAKNYIPQAPAIIQLYDFYYQETNSPLIAVNKTLKDAQQIISEVEGATKQ